MIDSNISNIRPAYAVAGGTAKFIDDMCCLSGTTSNICGCDDTREAGGGGGDDVALECCVVVFCCIFVFFFVGCLFVFWFLCYLEVF